jgi:short-subunit dehydrogenase
MAVGVIVKLKDRVVLITGASSGIGAELARQADARGSRVGLLARSTTELEKLRAELHGPSEIVTADVTSPEQVAEAVERVTATLGPVDVLVNNAGIGAYGAFLDTDADELERLMRTNYLGVVHVLKAVLPGMVDRRTGHVVNVGSIAGRIGAPFEAGYSASKFAVTGLTEALATELRPFGIGVSLVNPGPVDTPFFATRGHAYERKHPKPVSAGRVARSVIRCVERDRAEAFVAPVLRQAVVTKTLVPPLLRWGTARAFVRELAGEDANRPRRGEG